MLFAANPADNLVYFSALRNGDKENFFGAAVTRTPVDQSMNLKHVDAAASNQAAVEVALQGAHGVGVTLNGQPLGELTTKAKASAANVDVRRTWVLFPAMRLK